MVRSVLTALGAAALGAAALGSCTAGPSREDVAIQRLQTALCEKAEGCGCESSEERTCGQWPVPDRFGNTRAPELAYDPDCQHRWLSWLDELSCAAPSLPHYDEVCALYHGTIREGMPCQGTDVIETDCGRGLLCIAGTCRDPRRTSFGGLDEPCDLGGRCGDDTALCSEGRCQRLPSAGEPCLGNACAADAVCNDLVCEALGLIGEPCVQGLCPEGAYCDFDPMTGDGRCERLGDRGEPCFGHGECRSSNCPAGFCVDPAEPGDECSSQLPCGPDTFCIDGICQAFADDEVPTGSVCELVGAIL